MKGRQLLIIAGIPGAGKSTAARYIAQRWGAVSFESDQFLDQVEGPTSTQSGDFSDLALAEVYSAMAVSVSNALQAHELVLAVGSFRSEGQRLLLRNAAGQANANTATIRIEAAVEAATERVHSRIAEGGRAPTAEVIAGIRMQLDHAVDIDVRLENNGTIQRFNREIDRLLEPLVWALAYQSSSPTGIVEYFEERAAIELEQARSMIEPERLRTWPLDRVSAILRSGLPASVRLSVIPNAPQRCRVDVPAAYTSLTVEVLVQAGLRVASEKDGIAVFIPALTPAIRGDIIAVVEQELQLGRDRMRELRNYILLSFSRPFGAPREAALQKVTDKWVNAIDRLGNTVLSDILS